MTMKTSHAFVLNGTPVQAEADPTARLSDVLRDILGTTGVKVGCNAGDCGACSVLVDDRPVCACMMPLSRAKGRDIKTVEGLSVDPAAARLQRAFLYYGAAQCGICTPGMLIAAVALLKRNVRPDECETVDALGGVLCRCTGYRKIIEAVMNAHDFHAPDVVAEQGQAVGSRIARLDGLEKVIGQEIYSDDQMPDNALVVKVVRSPYHRAEFKIGDLDGFITDNPGVVRVLTIDDIPGENRFGVIPDFAEQPVFADKITRFRGEAVAAIAGEPDIMSGLDLTAFPISWHELPAVMTSAEALADGAPQLHKDRTQNIMTRGLVQRGSLSDEFSNADAIAAGNFSTAYVEHAYIEPEAGYARRVGDRIEIYAGTQAPYMDRNDMAHIMGLSVENVRIVPITAGGGFGSKLDISVQPYIALAAWFTGRPARIVYGRSESMMSTTKRHPAEIHARIGATKSGKLTAMDFQADFNTGAYASWGPTVANRVPVHASGPYYFPAYRAQTRAIHTNGPPSGAFRGFGVPQTAFAQETLFDELANSIGMDRLEFRLINALENGVPTITGQVMESGVGFKKCLESLKTHWRRANRDSESWNRENPASPLRRGIGVAGMWYGCGNTSLPNPSTMKVGLRKDGRAVLFQGAVDIGQGSNTVMAQICADAAGLPVDCFDLVYGDTDLTADAGKTSASRQTVVSGKASYLAGLDLRANLLRLTNAEDIADLSPLLSYLGADEHGFVAYGEGTYDPPTSPLDESGQGVPYAVYGYGAHLVELSVDTRLGTVKLIKVTAAHDIGRAINPMLVEGQIEGGVAQGIGLALMEEYIPGRTENLHDYLIPTIGDVPEIESILIEETDPHGPYGAKGIGEQALIPTAPAIVNAIAHACGARIRTLPATPARVVEAIRKSKDD